MPLMPVRGKSRARRLDVSFRNFRDALVLR